MGANVDRRRCRREIRVRHRAVRATLEGMHELVTGVRDVGRGLAALRAHPALWKWVAAPAAVTLLLLIAAVVGIVHAVGPAVDWAAVHLPGPLARIASPILTALVIGGLVAAALLV